MTVPPPLLGLVLALVGCKEDTKLRVNGVEPETGDAEGGSYVRIFGNRFIADGARNAKVYFGSHLGTVVRFASDSELIVQSPGGKPGDIVDITVQFEPGGEIKIQKEAYEKKKRGIYWSDEKKKDKEQRGEER